MKKPERIAENFVCRAADRMGILHSKLNVWGRRGLPDRIFWLPSGRPLLMEFKKESEEPTGLQWSTIKKLMRLGYPVEVVHDKYFGVQVLKTYAKQAGKAMSVSHLNEALCKLGWFDKVVRKVRQ